MFSDIRSYVDAAVARDPAARSRAEVVLLYPGVHALAWHKLSHWLYRHRVFGLARFLSQLVRFFTGIEIHPGAHIGRGVFIDHGMGVVIGENAIVGSDVTIYQGVTLGGTGKETGKRHPTIEDGVVVSAGAIVLGSINVGANSTIAGGAVAMDNVPKARGGRYGRNRLGQSCVLALRLVERGVQYLLVHASGGNSIDVADAYQAGESLGDWILYERKP